MPSPEEFVEHLRRDGAALREAAQGNLGAPVPSCPDWTVADLVRHTGEVHRKKLATMQLGGTTGPEWLDWQQPPDEEEALLDWYAQGLELLTEYLAAADPEQPAWSWAGDHRVAFWHRRMAQETAIHRWDAENAVGTPGPIPPDLAADGIDEYLRVFLDDPDTPPAGPTGVINITATDVNRSWALDITQWPPRVQDTTSHGALAEVTGTAEDVLLGLWRRIPLSSLSIGGDGAVVESFHDAADL